MSASSIIHLNKGGYLDAPEEYDQLGDTLPYIIEMLDKLATQIGVQPPRTFVFEDPQQLEEAEEGELSPELQERLETQREWSDVTEGLATFEALLEHFRKLTPKEQAELCKSTYRQVPPESVLYELEAFVSALEEAQGDSFRIEFTS